MRAFYHVITVYLFTFKLFANADTTISWYYWRLANHMRVYRPECYYHPPLTYQ